jgi:hypothetical protein
MMTVSTNDPSGAHALAIDWFAKAGCASQAGSIFN